MDREIAATSLLTLNEYCLLDIFKFLKLADIVNLNKTCTQLKLIGARVCAQKYKKTKIDAHYHRGMKDNNFADILSVIGEHILSLSVIDAKQSILQLIKYNCKNINRLELWSCEMPIEFDNLKELKLSNVRIGMDELKNCFARNAELECLDYDCSYEEDVLELLHLLPKLKTLHLNNISNFLHLNQHLCALDGLTQFSIHSPDNCNPLLTKLTKNSNFIELRICMPLDADTFGIIKSFRSIENLTMSQFGHVVVSVPENTVFPSTLKSLKFARVKISRKTLLSTVKQLNLLDELDLGKGYDLDESLDLNDRNVISLMAMALKAELAQRIRPLNIIYYDRLAANKERYIHNSPQLKIENDYVADNGSQAQRVNVYVWKLKTRRSRRRM